ncbi:hypothetical protein [Siminovitchia sp. 179-K 8D1 HS]|uniref:hypothetical protein n=1 Tax=Siminovitchia sp. 179-K 8D1 HS TaxID=3142385 RepID=UPI00399FA1BF
MSYEQSVKGLTWGTSKFTEIAKRGECEGEAKHEVNRLLSEIELLDMPPKVFEEARADAAIIFELCGGECQNWD